VPALRSSTSKEGGMSAPTKQARGPKSGIAITGGPGAYRIQRWKAAPHGAVYEAPIGEPFKTKQAAVRARRRLLEQEASS
jgi:hypothetical protein